MFHEWTLELKAMADRILSMRQQLFDALRARGTKIISKFDVLHALQVLD